MKGILYVIYQFLKIITRVSLGIFYPDVKVINQERLKFDFPAILVANHPNTLLDALQTAARAQKQVFFLANASLFKTPFQNWFFNTFYCIPIARKQDVNNGRVSNQESFERCNEFLGAGGSLFIAPEGSSFRERRLRTLKTGTARIALSAENARGFQLGLRIVPVGLNYEAPGNFRSGLLINVGDPIDLREFEEQYRADAFKAVKMVTALLEERMRSLIIDTVDDAEDRLVRNLETLLHSDNPVDQEAHFHRTQSLMSKLRDWKEESPADFQSFVASVDEYFRKLDEWELPDRVVVETLEIRNIRWGILALLAGFPFFLYGWVNNFLPAFIPAWLARRLNLSVEYESTVKVVAGLITFPLFYFLQYHLALYFLGNPWALAYLLSLPFSGIFAWEFRKLAEVWRKKRQWLDMCEKQPEQCRALKEQRERIYRNNLI